MSLAICVICRQKIRGSDMIDLRNPSSFATLLALHLIDEHWDVVTRIRATTDDPDGRLALVGVLSGEGWANPRAN